MELVTKVSEYMMFLRLASMSQTQNVNHSNKHVCELKRQYNHTTTKINTLYIVFKLLRRLELTNCNKSPRVTSFRMILG